MILEYYGHIQKFKKILQLTKVFNAQTTTVAIFYNINELLLSHTGDKKLVTN